ncbi:MAG: glycyl-radical enzyme activating protein [Lachnospiraceae bacterium]|nr:glycyl-radical enzyme activating protein [Lachnospiraceae bacterium]
MGQINYELKGIVFNTQRFSVRDGKGIRTIVFLKGCPLHCRWCSNPESQVLSPMLLYDADVCIHCGRCIATCKQGALSPENPHFIDRSKCITCGECTAVCPVSALTIKGTYMTVSEVIKELKKDESAYRRSGGGITVSGGEGLVQHEFLVELFKAVHAQGWTTCMETTGFAPPQVIEEVFPHVEQTLLDIKCMDPEKHKEHTGVSNELILRNAPRICELSPTTIRVPVIPGFNYSEEDIRQIVEFVKTLPNVKAIHLLPYHSLGLKKYALLGRDYLIEQTQNLHKEEVAHLEKIVLDAGFESKVGG